MTATKPTVSMTIANGATVVELIHPQYTMGVGVTSAKTAVDDMLAMATKMEVEAARMLARAARIRAGADVLAA